jgi:hypothetical protein
MDLLRTDGKKVMIHRGENLSEQFKGIVEDDVRNCRGAASCHRSANEKRPGSDAGPSRSLGAIRSGS